MRASSLSDFRPTSDTLGKNGGRAACRRINDSGMLKASYQGSGNALIIEGDTLTVVNQNGAADLSPIAHPKHFGRVSEALDD
jgi:hypothetical protein